MGKNKKNQKKNQPQSQEEPVKKETPKKQLEVKQTTNNDTAPVEPEQIPEEKANDYKEELLRVLNDFRGSFQQIDETLNAPCDIESKRKLIERREKDEYKKLEKTFKKEQFEFEEVYNDTSSKVSNPEDKAKAMAARLWKTIDEIAKVKGQV